MNEPRYVNSNEVRLAQLQQIPVFAIQDLLLGLLDSGVTKADMTERIVTAVDIIPREIESTLRNLTRAQLTLLLAEYPEIDESTIARVFREYCYGVNPSFRVYRINGSCLSGSDDLDELRARVQHEFGRQFESSDAFAPTFKSLALNELAPMPDHPNILDGNYRVLHRLSYIDEHQMAVTTYKTLYGFFWIVPDARYVIIHAPLQRVQKAVQKSIEEATKVSLVSFRIPKQLQKELIFLRPETIRSSKLSNPDPSSDDIQSVTLSGDGLHKKRGFAEFFEAYPETPRINYRDEVVEGKETTLVVNENGSLTVYGKLQAVDFRRWCISRVGYIIDAVERFAIDGRYYLSTLDLNSSPELQRLPKKRQRKVLLELIEKGIALKNGTSVSEELSLSPLEFATLFGKLVHAQIRFSCQVPECDEEGYLACSTCGCQRLRIVAADPWEVHCYKHKNSGHFWARLPLTGKCERLHPYEYCLADVEQQTEVFLLSNLQTIVNEICTKYLDGIEFSFERETIYVSGRNIMYHKRRTERSSDTTVFEINNSNIGGDLIQVDNIRDSNQVALGRDSEANVTQSRRVPIDPG